MLTLILRIFALIVLCDQIAAASFMAERAIADNYWEGEILVEEQEPVTLDIPVSFLVTVTVYSAVAGQTDDTPNIPADGIEWDIETAHEDFPIALSRNMLKRWGGMIEYGNIVELRGTKYLDGYYIVRDNMNARYKDWADVLVPAGSPDTKHKNVTLRIV
jgi:hypothetical protein